MWSLLAVIAFCVIGSFAFDNTRYDNLAVYWGQNSWGAAHSSDTANFQKTLSYYCQDNSIDVFPVAFLNVFFGTGGLPSMNLANTCNSVDNATFPGTALANCQALASDIATCQAKGKIITLSLGGATGSVGFQSDAQASSFADTIWNLFLGGSSSTRPFGTAVLDGIDLDIEGGSSSYYATFISRIRTLSNGASKKYYVTAAPQCPYPDSALGAVLNAVSFDAVYVQFYNNVCGLQNYPTNNWDFGIWDFWAKNVSPNKAVKVYIGAPASNTAAGSGYVDAATLGTYAAKMRKSFPSFGGVMLWDASQAYANGRFDQTIKSALVAAGGTGFTYPSCSAPTYAAGTGYSAGQQVSYNGYIWQAKWYASGTPTADFNGDWNPISACSSTGSTPPPTTSTTSTTTSQPTTTTTVTTPTTRTTTTTSAGGGGGTCAGVSAWSSSVAYTGGQQASYGGHLWQAKWWTQADTPGGAAGVWTDLGACAAVDRSQAPGIGASAPAITSVARLSGDAAALPQGAESGAVAQATSAPALNEPGRRSSRMFRL